MVTLVRGEVNDVGNSCPDCSFEMLQTHTCIGFLF